VRKRLLGYLAALLIAYGLILLAVRLFENKIIFYPDYPGRLDGDWNPNSLPLEDVWMVTSDRVKLHAWWIPNPRARFTFLAFHGNAGNIAGRAEVYRFLWQLPANVLAIEYRGYGHSEGSPTEAGLYLDAQAGYDYAFHSLNIPPQRMISFGQSLGTAIAVDLAAQRPVAAVVLEAPFPSTRAVARRVYPYLPGVALVAKSRFDTTEKLGRVHAPVLIVHCTQDPVIAYSLGEQVYQRASSPKFFFRVDGMCHEEASLVAPARYRQQLLEFLSGIAPVK